jgi:signal transduction histidine kinase/ligand-binding sensor domain-containing protein
MFRLIAQTKKLSLYFLTACWLFISLHTSAQRQNFYFTNYGVKDGMSNGIVDDLFRDSEGFLWIATYNGLDRFDGTNFKIFHADYHNPDALVDDYVQHICEDHQGNVWCGCDKGVSCYNKSTGKFHSYHLTNPNGFNVNANHVYNILCDRQGIIWCSTDGGVFEYDKNHDSFKGYYHNEKEITSLTSDNVSKNAFVEDPHANGIWMSGPRGINYLDTKTKVFYNYRNNPNHEPVFTNEIVYPITFDKYGKLCFIIKGKCSLYYYDLYLKKLSKDTIQIPGLNNASLKSIATLFFDSNNKPWISSWSSKLYFRPEGKNVFVPVVHDNNNPNSINSNFFWDVIEDKDGTLWFGGVNGISKFQSSSQYYTLLKPNETLRANERYTIINALYQVNDTALLLGTDKGLYAYNLVSGYCKKFKSNPYTNKNNINFITNVGDKLWLVDVRNISVFDIEGNQYVQSNPLPDDLKKNPQIIGNIYRCRNRDVWLVTGDSRELYLLKHDHTEWIHYAHDINDPHSIAPLVTVAMFEDEQGVMWFGTMEDGIMRYDSAKNNFDFFRHAYTDSSKVRIVNLLRIFSAGKNQLYLVPDRLGLIRFNYKDSTAKIYRQSDGLATESNFDAVLDHNKNIWLAGYQDVTEFTVAKNSFTRFHIDYANDNYDYGNVLIALKNGDIGISISDAIAMYKPGSLISAKDLPRVLISDFSVFEKSIPFTQKSSNIHLTYKQNFFSFSFSAFSSSHEPLQYAYKLEGFDEDWVYCGKRQFASYTNVSGGDYTFLVKAAVSNGEWSSPTIIHISVSPPFWETYWFRGIVTALLIFLVIVIFKIRERNYREKQEQKLQLLKVRDKIAQDLHDDIGASLSSIRMYSEAVRLQVKEKLPQADMILERISENSKEIVENMSDIVWAINPKNDSLQFMEDRMHAFTAAVCSSKNIVPHFNKIDFHELKLPMEKRKNIFLIFKEAINNAAKYAACKNIFLNMEKNDKVLSLTIADDGKGFDVSKATSGNGLTNMQKRANELNAEIVIESKINEGTIVKLFVPLNDGKKRIPTNGELKT